jgi:hypothetical protein
MEESKQKDLAGGSGKCNCKDFQPPNPFPDDKQSIRRLLKAIEEELETDADNPTDATKKLGEDIKDADKEYLGIEAVVTSYEKFYDKLDCLLADASKWKDELESWCKEKVNTATQVEIKKLRDKYDQKEKERCCAWLADREKLNQLKDCLGQATVKADEAKDDYSAYKDFEKTLNARFAELKSLFEKAGGLRAAEKHKSVCAVGLEFDEVYDYLGVVWTWKAKGDECKGSSPTSTGDLKKEWSPDELKKALSNALRGLILARYQCFRWAKDLLKLQVNSKKNKEACDQIKKTRRDEFIQEAEDINPPNSSSTSQQQTAY